MFMGHYAAALAAKAVEPRAPLWSYVAAAELLDIAWSVLITTGAERVRFDTSLPGASLILEHMPWTHSLPAAIAWALAAGLLAASILKLPRRAAAILALAVFAHWPLDLLVHRPDLALWFNGPKVGLALWNAPVLEATLEMGLLGLAGAAWMARRAQTDLNIWPALTFLAGLLGVQLLSLLTPSPSNTTTLATTTLAIYVLITVAAAIVENRGRRRGGTRAALTSAA